MANDYTHVYTASGHLDGEMIRLFLESKGIPALAYGESAGATYGLTVGPLGVVKIYVPQAQAEEAMQILSDMEQGKYETSQMIDSLEDEDGPDQPE